MKYIITFEDEPSMMEEGVAFYKCEEAPWWSASDHLIGRLAPYEEVEDAPEAIRIGDEVAYESGDSTQTFVITRISGGQADGVTSVPSDNFEIGETDFCNVYDIRKTGRHFDLPWMEEVRNDG